ARGHKLPVGRVGVVGYCAGTGEPRIAQDVGAEIVYYDNPDMPDTRSEMALPLIVRDQVIGVLDVQSRDSNAFKPEDIEVVQMLADQIALAIDNAQLFESSQKALEELQSLYSQAATTAWKQKLTGKEFIYQYDSTGITRKADQSTADITQESGAPLSRPISFRGQIIGNLDFVREDQRMNWTEDEVRLIEEILEQTALALENARLVDQIRLRSDQIQLLQEITAMAASILDEKELLTKVAEKLQSSLLIHHCGIALLSEDGEQLELIASAGADGQPVVTGERIILSEDNLTQRVLENSKVSAFHNYVDEPEYQTFVQYFSAKKGETLILIPLVIREDLIGYIFLEDTEENRQSDQEETNLFQQIGAQLSTAIESARLFSAEQEGRLAAAALLEITQIASASLDMNRVLNQATNRSAQAIQAHRCTIFLLDEKEKIKPLISIYADGQQLPEHEWELLQDKIHAAYHEVPLRDLVANLRTPKIINNPLTYTNIPMGWVEKFQIQKILMVPLISQNKVIGSMIYDQIDPDHSFRETQVEVAQTIAGQIATAIENSKLFEDAVLRAERERQVSKITAKIRATNDPEQIMETAIAELRLALAKSSEQTKNNPLKYGKKPNSSGKKNGNDTGTRQ
ncbi:MAG: GAF domain-containing protein, partial [Anaerolineales bacterium]